jgi:hypothetical protein
MCVKIGCFQLKLSACYNNDYILCPIWWCTHASNLFFYINSHALTFFCHIKILKLTHMHCGTEEFLNYVRKTSVMYCVSSCLVLF